MGQAFNIVNLDRNEYIHPHDCGDGYKLLELNHSLSVLAVLLSDNDDHPWHDCPLHGQWAGCRVVVAGEYGFDVDAGPMKRLDVAKVLQYLREA